MAAAVNRAIAHPLVSGVVWRCLFSRSQAVSAFLVMQCMVLVLLTPPAARAAPGFRCACDYTMKVFLMQADVHMLWADVMLPGTVM